MILLGLCFYVIPSFQAIYFGLFFFSLQHFGLTYQVCEGLLEAFCNILQMHSEPSQTSTMEIFLQIVNC